ncbi:P-loop containing nucleoside triphosphate hydrolase protein [Mycena galericulata]|nr:P-loop containing nucleoside triphosphate hydrolase protein [Mycena galericulata]
MRSRFTKVLFRCGLGFKLVIVGDGACGKACVALVHIPTVFENYVADVDVDGKHIELALWDTAGQEDYDRLRALSYPNAHVILICFAVDNPDSVNNVKEKWITEVQHFCPRLPVILVGCKADLREEPRVVEKLWKENRRPVVTDAGRAVATLSTKSGRGVKEVFQEAATVAIPRHNPCQRPYVVL